MSVRAITVVVLALICGGMAVLGVRQLAGNARGGTAPETTPVVMAKEQISRGTVLTAAMLTTRPWPRKLAPTGSLVTIEECAGRASLGPILAGEPILDGKLASKDAGRGLAALVPVGMRAYAIQTARDASNVAGFILPGNRVDVLLSLTCRAQDDETGGGSTVTLLQSVEILAVAQRLDAPADNKVDPKEMRSVTLLVTPDQAAVLDLGQNMGKLTLSLRNPEDVADATPAPATLRLLRFLQKGPVDPDALDDKTASDTEDATAPKKEPQRFEIRTLRGGHAGRVYISSNE